MPKAATYLSLSITVVNPPAGVVFVVQRGRAELETPVMASGDNLSFNFEVRVGDREDEMPNFLGPFVQGPRGGRFVYVNSGTLAGQADSCWTRRAKVGLKGIGWDPGRARTCYSVQLPRSQDFREGWGRRSSLRDCATVRRGLEHGDQTLNCCPTPIKTLLK